MLKQVIRARVIALDDFPVTADMQHLPTPKAKARITRQSA